MRQNTDGLHAAQLGFDALLVEAEEANRRTTFAKAHGHLPDTMEEAVPFYRDLVDRHHAAMLTADLDKVLALREDAHRLALVLNHGEPGILAGPGAPGCRLATLTRAEDGTVPLWGQEGCFIIDVEGMRVRIAMDGLFGIGAPYGSWLNFAAHAVDWDRPFLSPTGYRSFLGLRAELVPGLTTDAFAVEVIAEHVAQNLKGRLVDIEARYRERIREEGRE